MTHPEPQKPPVLRIDIFPAGKTFDCCDCGESMERVAYHHEIIVGDGRAIRFICEKCRPNYLSEMEQVVVRLVPESEEVQRGEGE